MIKGGVWKNTEDEILKAAVSKYGKNQWARISSLLVRKSPKQCKARWFEWLDPSIKKTEWSKEEDEKLLHLAKLMPTQWRTIAPIVGRTPAQCLERYQRLLDEAEQSVAGKEDLGLTGAGGHETGPNADDVRKLRPGEVDPEPESKPARPDPVDMDEDEKEMLSEARARLANTQGKKAKRKARERQLEEARRLTTLQKRRELKAAGINVRVKKMKNTMDYNTDIPFEKRAPLGFFDVTEEKAQKPNAELLTNVRLSKLNRRRADIEEEKERERKRKQREAGATGNKSEGNQGRFVPAKDAKIIKMQEQEQIAKRRKLVLPAPQVGEEELDEIVKTGFAGESAKSLVQAEDTDHATTTPLRGTTSTPSTYGNQTPFKTPLRDHFNINDQQESIAATPRDEKMAQIQRKRALLQGLSSLPKPRNEWEIRLPDVGDEEEKDEIKTDQSSQVEDMSEVEKRNKEMAIKNEQEQLGRRSLVVQRGLPRPTSIPASIQQVNQHLDDIQAMIQQEFIRLLQHDAIKYPVVGGSIAPGATPLEGDLTLVEEEFDTATLEDARKEMDLELKEMLDLDETDVQQAVWNHVSNQPGYQEKWDQEHDDLLFSAKFKQFMTLDEMPDDKDKIQGLEKIIESNRQAMIRDATKAGKLEKKLEVRLGGYMARSNTLSQQIIEAFEALEAAKIEHSSFLNLQMAEKVAIPRRIQGLEEEVQRLAQREKDLQQKYKLLSEEKSHYLEGLV
ncbi:pre-mRNA splicing factor component-domain-containing protein [Halteromyces radiatus]|uniref:pre-mRNA splicing factor component-domain-containing protein n=1 Tax=Halteromyces radiatus TaxID=101107 RepID=UPI0022203DB8|nr:pre-mRNA splicing factor component-domain-containing protein [Halteromyces radiatus]KAI8096219.1 pre-mRNA splicing factor component-domain-containing protein [Halteromyces radiatus]